MSKIFTGFLSVFLVCLWLSGCAAAAGENPVVTGTQVSPTNTATIIADTPKTTLTPTATATHPTTPTFTHTPSPSLTASNFQQEEIREQPTDNQPNSVISTATTSQDGIVPENQWVLLLKFSRESYFSYFCKKGVYYSGEIGAYDLKSEKYTPLISNQNQVSYEDLVLKSDEPQFATILIDQTGGFSQYNTSEAFVQTYADSDKILLFDLKQSSQTQLLPSYSRAEAIFANETCSAATGLMELLGWSPTSLWFGYFRKTLNGGVLDFVKLEGAAEPIEFTNLRDGGWSQYQDEYLAINYQQDPPEITLIKFADTIELITYRLPSELTNPLSLGATFWVDPETVYLIFNIEIGVLKTKSSLWSLNVESGEWKKLNELGVDIFRSEILSNNYLFTCSKGENRIIQIRELTHDELLYEQPFDGYYGCSSLFIAEPSDTDGIQVILLQPPYTIRIISIYNRDVKYIDFILKIPARLENLDVTDIAVVDE